MDLESRIRIQKFFVKLVDSIDVKETPLLDLMYQDNVLSADDVERIKSEVRGSIGRAAACGADDPGSIPAPGVCVCVCVCVCVNKRAIQVNLLLAHCNFDHMLKLLWVILYVISFLYSLIFFSMIGLCSPSKRKATPGPRDPWTHLGSIGPTPGPSPPGPWTHPWTSLDPQTHT